MTGGAAALGALAAGLVLSAAAPQVGAPGPAGRHPLGRRPCGPEPRVAAIDPRRLAAIVLGPVRRPRPARVFALGSAVVLLAVVAPALAPLPVVVPLARAHVVARRVRRSHATAVTRGLPDAVDLLLLCAGAGLSLPLAHPLVAERTPPPLGVALQQSVEAAAGGRVRADVLLDAMVPLGDRAAALAHVLVDHLRYGVPLVPGLERLGLELRLDRRRRAEEQARRVPIRLLAPLITCVLPAFGLLTVVPLLVASLRSLPR